MSHFSDALSRALERRSHLRASGVDAYRALVGESEGTPGVDVDVYGPGAALLHREGEAPSTIDPLELCREALDVLAPVGVRGVYLKPFAKDRSRMGGVLPAIVTDPTPAAGESLPESILVREHGWTISIRLSDGLSTGIFLDQRANRRWVHDWCATFTRRTGTRPNVLNTFAYTCAFSLAAAKAGATTASVDLSRPYLDWGKANFNASGIDPEHNDHRFARMDVFEFVRYATRKGISFDLAILDPPSFSAGDRAARIPAWSSAHHYSRLVTEAASILRPGGTILACTNTKDLCLPGRLAREIDQGLRGRAFKPLTLPPLDADTAPLSGSRFAALACELR